MVQLNTAKQILFIKTTGIRVCLPNNKGVIMASWKQNTFESRINLLVSRSSCSTSLSSQPDFLQNIPSNIKKTHTKQQKINCRQHTHIRWKHGRTKVSFQFHFLQFLLMLMPNEKSRPKGPFPNLLKNLVMLHWKAPYQKLSSCIQSEDKQKQQWWD